jgi:hypothetical protein
MFASTFGHHRGSRSNALMASDLCPVPAYVPAYVSDLCTRLAASASLDVDDLVSIDLYTDSDGKEVPESESESEDESQVQMQTESEDDDASSELDSESESELDVHDGEAHGTPLQPLITPRPTREPSELSLRDLVPPGVDVDGDLVPHDKDGGHGLERTHSVHQPDADDISGALASIAASSTFTTKRRRARTALPTPNCLRYGEASTCAYCGTVVVPRVHTSTDASGTRITVEEGAEGYQCSRCCTSFFCSAACLKDGFCCCMWERMVRHRATV